MPEKQQRRTDAVRQAVDDAFTAAAGQAQASRGRAQDIVDELAGAAGRLRDVVDELRPPTADEVRALRGELADLTARIERLEAERAAPPEGGAAPRKRAPRRPPAAT